MGLAIGVDIGGTNTRVGLINPEGDVIAIDRFATSALYPLKLKDDLIKAIVKMYSEKEITGIGIASAGRVNFASKEITYTTDNLKDWADINIAKILEKEFNVPVYIDNDVNAALFCHIKFSSYPDNSTLIFLTIGTGLGGAVAHNNTILRGNTGSAGEFGHMLLYPGGKQCNCGKKGCAEQYISGPAYRRRLTERFRQTETEYTEKDLTINNIKKYIIKGQQPYLSVFKEMISDLTLLLENLKNCLDYDICLIGGGFSVYGDILIAQIEKEFSIFNHKYAQKPIFEIATQGNKTGLIGAGLMVFDNI